MMDQTLKKLEFGRPARSLIMSQLQTLLRDLRQRRLDLCRAQSWRRQAEVPRGECACSGGRARAGAGQHCGRGARAEWAQQQRAGARTPAQWARPGDGRGRARHREGRGRGGGGRGGGEDGRSADSAGGCRDGSRSVHGRAGGRGGRGGPSGSGPSGSRHSGRAERGEHSGRAARGPHHSAGVRGHDDGRHRQHGAVHERPDSGRGAQLGGRRGNQRPAAQRVQLASVNSADGVGAARGSYLVAPLHQQPQLQLLDSCSLVCFVESERGQQRRVAQRGLEQPAMRGGLTVPERRRRRRDNRSRGAG